MHPRFCVLLGIVYVFDHFDALLEQAKQKSPEHALVCINCVGAYARFLVSDEAHLVTGSNVYIDAGFNIMGT